MIKITELISLPVINLYNLKIEGYIEKVCIDANKKKPLYLLVYSEQIDEYKVVEFKNIYKICCDAVFIANSTKITLYENKELILETLVCPLNSLCFTFDGVKIGKIDEIYIENGTLHSIETGGENHPICEVVGWSDELTLLSSQKVNLCKFKEKNTFQFNLKNEDVVVQIQDTPTPIREITNYDFLLKRRVQKEIKNDNGEVIARPGTLITFNLINKLKYYGKLKELTVNSK